MLPFAVFLLFDTIDNSCAWAICEDRSDDFNFGLGVIAQTGPVELRCLDGVLIGEHRCFAVIFELHGFWRGILIYAVGDGAELDQSLIGAGEVLGYDDGVAIWRGDYFGKEV